MDLKEALKYLVDMGESQLKIERVMLPDGTEQVYSNTRLERLDKHIFMAKGMRMSTLTSLVDYIKGNIDTMADRMVIHVEGPEKVSLFSRLNE